MKKRRPFSILEILLAIGIIVIVGASLAINFHSGHIDRQEKDVVDLIESKLRMAAGLAKLSNGQVRVVFGEHEGKKAIFLSPDMAFSERMKVAFSHKTPLPRVQEVEVVPNNEKGVSVSFFPWGVLDRNTEVQITFTSGKKVACLPAKYAPNVIIEDQSVIETLYPREIAEDEKEEEK